LSIQTTYSQARANFASLWDQVTQNREIVIIQRRGMEDVALISVSELEGLLETAHLLRSPANAKRLLTALDRARQRQGARQSLTELRRAIGLEQKAAGHEG
jgi:antitoxin YefM